MNNGDGTFTYTPNSGFAGNDSFTYTVEDGAGGSSTATITVTVNEIVVTPPGTPDGETFVGGDGDDTLGGEQTVAETVQTTTPPGQNEGTVNPAPDGQPEGPPSAEQTPSAGPDVHAAGLDSTTFTTVTDQVGSDASTEDTDELEILDPRQDLSEYLQTGPVAGAEPATSNIDLFAVVGGPDYPTVESDPEIAGVSAEAVEFTSEDIRPSDGEMPSVPHAVAAQRFADLFQPVQVEPDEEFDLSDLPGLPEWAFVSTGNAQSSADSAPLGDGPVLSERQQQAENDSSEAPKTSSRASFFALLWGLIRGTGKTGDDAGKQSLPDQKHSRSRR